MLTTARLLTHFFVQRGHQVVSGQLHGMAQRAGAVQSSVMVDSGISPAIPEGGADFVLGFEPVETVRALRFIASKTTVFMNTRPVIPFVLGQQYVRGRGKARYPDVSRLADCIRSVTTNLGNVDATALAEESGSSKALNMVMLGCLFGSGLLPYPPEDFMNTLLESPPTWFQETNRQAFLSGMGFAKAVQVVGDVE